MKAKQLLLLAATVTLSPNVTAQETHSSNHGQVSDQIIAEQRNNLAKHTDGKGFGPQSPRDIDSVAGNNRIDFTTAPAYTDMNLCNIHFHKNAEHAGGEFAKYAGNGDHSQYVTGLCLS